MKYVILLAGIGFRSTKTARRLLSNAKGKEFITSMLGPHLSQVANQWGGLQVIL